MDRSAFLFHSRMSAALNVSDQPREVFEAVVLRPTSVNWLLPALRDLSADSRWREFMRGVYWLLMPAYAEAQFIDADRRCRVYTGTLRPTCAACSSARSR